MKRVIVIVSEMLITAIKYRNSGIISWYFNRIIPSKLTIVKSNMHNVYFTERDTIAGNQINYTKFQLSETILYSLQ